MTDISAPEIAKLEARLLELRANAPTFAEQDAYSRAINLIHDARMATRRAALARRAKKLGLV